MTRDGRTGTRLTERHLRLVDRAADGRARVYGHELDALIQTAKAMGLDVVPVSAIEPIVDRMLDRNESTAGVGHSLDGFAADTRLEVTD